MRDDVNKRSPGREEIHLRRNKINSTQPRGGGEGKQKILNDTDSGLADLVDDGEQTEAGNTGRKAGTGGMRSSI